MKEKKLFIVWLVVMMVCFGLVYAASTTVTFVIPSSISHSIAYGGNCDASNFFFVENDTTKNGVQNAINVSSTNAGTSMCQSPSFPAMNISNGGTVNINVTANFTTAMPTGVTVKAANGAGGYQATCSGTISTVACTVINASTPTKIAKNITALTGKTNVWIWADFGTFNSGLAGEVARTMKTFNQTG